MSMVDLNDVRRRFENLKSQRSTREKEWMDLRDYIAPDCGRFDSPSAHLSDDRWENIIDPCATAAAETLAAGMLGGMTSPARPWFQLTTMSPKLDEQYEVKAWLSDVTEELLMVFAGSNVYEALHKAYFELAVFGTACLVALPSTTSVIRVEALTIGEYWLAEDDEGRVDTLYRQYAMTAKQMISAFGRSKCPQVVLDAYDSNHGERTFTVIQAIEPRNDRDPSKVDSLNMPWRSVHFMPAARPDEGALLEEGFTHFPGLCPRWVVRGNSVYGTSVGMMALPKVKALQGQHVDMSYGIGYMSRPPLVIPTGLEGREADLRPGGVLMGTGLAKGEMIQSAINVNFNLQYLDAVIQRGQKEIESIFYKDLFLMLSNTARDTRTAYEVEQLQQEKMLMLGPVLERLHTELLGPLISAAYDYCARAGRIPEPPEAVTSSGLNINYISVLALAQKASALNGYTNFMQALASVAQAMPQSNAADLLDTDSYLRKLADMLGVDPKHLRDEKEVSELRDQRNQAMAQQAQLNQLQQTAAIGKDALGGIAQAAGAAPGTLEQYQGY